MGGEVGRVWEELGEGKVLSEYIVWIFSFKKEVNIKKKPYDHMLADLKSSLA